MERSHSHEDFKKFFIFSSLLLFLTCLSFLTVFSYMVKKIFFSVTNQAEYNFLIIKVFKQEFSNSLFLTHVIL